MRGHVGIAVTVMARSITFYEQALAPLGITWLMAYGGTDDVPDHVGFGSDRKPYLRIGKGQPIGGYVHIALGAAGRASVDAFHGAAIAAVGTDNGAPGLRPQYHLGYYGAFVLDPDGCNLEAVHHSF